MSRGNKPRDRARRPRNRRAQNQRRGLASIPQQIVGLLKRAWRICIVVGVVGGLLEVGSYFFSRNIKVEADTSYDSRNPLTTPFVITNEGPLPIHLESILCGVRLIKSATFTIQGPGEFITAATQMGTLYHNQQTTFIFPYDRMVFMAGRDTIAPNFCDISIVVCYRPSLAFWRFRYTQRFMTKVDPTGVPRWHPEPSPSDARLIGCNHSVIALD
jgi:hypothetical protein